MAAHDLSPASSTSYSNATPCNNKSQQSLLYSYLPAAPAFARSSTPTPSNSSSTSSAGGKASSSTPRSKTTHRQTRISEHLRAVKQGSPSSSSCSTSSAVVNLKQAMAPAKSTRSLRNSTQLIDEVIAHDEDSGPTPIVETRATAITRKGASRSSTPAVLPAVASSSTADAPAATTSDNRQALLRKLALHGITPSDQVLDDTMHILTSRQQDLTVESFLEALATLDDGDQAPPSPNAGDRPSSPATLHINIPPPQKSSFSFLESPSTPSETLRPAFEFTSPPRGSASGSQSSSSLLLRTPPQLLPALEPLPITPRTQRLSAFSTISTPRPSPASISARPTTRQTRNRPQPPPPIPLSTMVAAQVEGMGRVALSRSTLFAQLGEDSAELAIKRGALTPTTPAVSLAFGFSSTGEATVQGQAFNAFGAAASKSDVPVLSLKPKRGGGKIGSHVVDERLGRVRSWLESDDEEEQEEGEEKRGLTWSMAPKEWRLELEEEERRRLVERRLEPEIEVEYVEVEEEEEEVAPVLHQQVRVSGKNIRVLLQSKRKRVEEDGDLEASERGEGDVGGTASEVEVEQAMEEEEQVEQVVKAPEHVQTPPKTRASLAMQMDRDESSRPNGKGRAAEDVVDCVCRSTEEGEEPMIQCDDCRVWLHLACLHIPSSRRLPKEWSCFRCTDSHPPTPQHSAKRVRISTDTEFNEVANPIDSPSTPSQAHQEPILVASSTSPRPRNTFYRGYGAPDMVLAPSPQSSPIRRHATVPRSPAPANLVAIPVTPKLVHDSRAADYSPRSPLFYRSGRVRMVSGSGGAAFEQHHHQGGWVGGWDGHVFGTASGYEEHYPMEAEDDFQPKSWHDMTMTPSRTVASSFDAWETPGARARRGSSGAHNATNTPRTASQSFLSGLHGDAEALEASGGGHQRAPSFAQRLFGSPTHHHRAVVPSSTSAYPPPSSSSLHTRIIRQRVPSVPFGHSHQAVPFNASSTSALASNPFSAVGPIARRGSLEYATSSGYRQQQSMARSASGGFEHVVGIDDLLAL